MMYLPYSSSCGQHIPTMPMGTRADHAHKARPAGVNAKRCGAVAGGQSGEIFSGTVSTREYAQWLPGCLARSVMVLVLTQVMLLCAPAQASTNNEKNLEVSTGERLTLDGDHYYSESVIIRAGGTLSITQYDGTENTTTGRLRLISPSVTIEGTGIIDGKGSGHPGGAKTMPGGGPGGGIYTSKDGIGGGGGYGGQGGGPVKSTTYGTNTGIDIDMGSGGAGSSGTSSGGSGNGGGTLTIIAGTLDISGTILVDGADAWGNIAAGGGSGGGILLVVGTCDKKSGTLSANGGVGKGGGGGGGRIKAPFSPDKMLLGGGAGKTGEGYNGLTGTSVTTLSLNDFTQDTDADGLNDYEEVLFLSHPFRADSDDDGLNDFQERELGTNPNNQDTDADDLKDGDEATRGTDPTKPDTDGDGLNDGDEVTLGTDPTKRDTDADGFDDLFEVNSHGLFNPVDPDPNHNGISEGPADPDGDGPILAGPDTAGSFEITCLTHPSVNRFYNDNSPVFSWTPPPGTPACLWSLEREARKLDNNTGELETGTQISKTGLGHGLWWFNIRPLDENLNPMDTYCCRPLRVNAYAPVIASSSHPDQALSYPKQTATFTWTNRDVPSSDIAKYYYAFDTSPTTRPTKISQVKTGTSHIQDKLADGTYFLHLASEDSLGNLSLDVSHFRVNISTGAPGNIAPVAAVAETQIDLANLASPALLDGSPSLDPDGGTLYYSWRENPVLPGDNPVTGLVPRGSEGMPRLPLHFPVPGRYVFNLAVSDGRDASANTVSIAVNVPGLAGFAYALPTPETVRVPDAWVGVYASSGDAEAWKNPVAGTITDSLGCYRLESLAGNGSSLFLRWRDTASKYLPSVTQPILLHSANSEQNLGLERPTLALGLSGTILNAFDLLPVSGLTVGLVPGILADKFGTTNESGNFSISNAWEGPWLLQLHQRGYAADTRDIHLLPGTPLNLSVQPTDRLANLNGTVTLLGTDFPLSDARIVLGDGDQTSTDENGSFAFVHMPVGTYSVTITKEGCEPTRELFLPLEEGDNYRNFPIAYRHSGPFITGIVKDRDTKRPLSGATVALMGAQGLMMRSDVTDSTGYYRLNNVPPGESLSFVASAAGYMTETLGKPSSFDMPIELTQGTGWIAPALPNPSAPIATLTASKTTLSKLGEAAVLSAGPTGDSVSYSWRENPSNPAVGLLPAGADTLSQFSLTFPLPGVYTFGVQVVQNGLASPNAATTTISVPGLQGKVTRSPSNGIYPIANIAVRAYNSYSEAKAWATHYVDSDAASHADGSYSLENLGPGSYWIAASDKNLKYNYYGPVQRFVNYGPTTVGNEINMTRSSVTVEGIISTDEASPIPLENVRVVIVTGIESERFQTSTDQEGRYTLTDIPSGEWYYVVQKDGYEAEAGKLDVNSTSRLQNWSLADRRGESVFMTGTVTTLYEGSPYPVSDAEVVLDGGCLRTYTDANGRYAFENLSPGAHVGVVRKHGYRTSIAGGDAPSFPDFQLEFDGPGPVVFGQMKMPDGTPAPGVAVSILFASGFKAGSVPVLSDSTGYFALNGVPDGIRDFQITLPDSSQFVVTANVTGSMRLPLTNLAVDPSTPVLYLTPRKMSVGAVAGTKTLSVQNTGGGNLVWTVTTPQGAPWLKASRAKIGGNGTVSLDYEKNTTAESRTGTVTIEANGAVGSPATVTVEQAGLMTPVLAVTSQMLDLEAAGAPGTTEVVNRALEVTNRGGGLLEWSATVTAGEDWLSATPSGTVRGDGIVNITAGANSDATPRQGTIHVEGSGAAAGSSVDVTVTQAGTDTPLLDITPRDVFATEAAQDLAVEVSNKGGGTLAWEASLTSGTDWLSLNPPLPSATVPGSFTLRIPANDTGMSRAATVKVEAAGALGSPITLTVTQAANSMPVLSVEPALMENMSALGDTKSFSVSNAGFGTLSWTAAVGEGMEEWLSVSSGTGTGSGSVAVTALPNPTNAARNGTVVVSAAGANGSPFTVTVVQNPNTTPKLSVTPNALGLLATGTAKAVSVSNAGFGTLGWTVQVVTGSGWLQVNPKSGTGAMDISVGAAPNPSPSDRAGQLRIWAAGATDSPVDVWVTQFGTTTPVLLVAPTSLSMLATEQTKTLAITNAATGTLAWTAQVGDGKDWISVLPGSGTTPGSVSVTVLANTGTTSRSGSVVVSSADAVGGPITVTVAQDAPVAGPKGSLTVTIVANGAVGAQWCVDGGTWMNDGATVGNLSVGEHTVSYKTVAGWTSPADYIVNVVEDQTATVMGTYTVATGSLKMTITPPAAVTAGAKWRVDGGTANDSDATVANLSPGSHTVTFTSVQGWTAPESRVVTVTAGETLTDTGNYQPRHTLTTSVVNGNGTLAPSTGPQDHNATVTLTAAPEYGYQVKAWTGTNDDLLKTNTNTVTMTSDKTVSVEFEADSTQGLTVTILPPEAVADGATWSVDGGTANPSGTSVTGLSAGAHTVTFSALEGWNTPDGQNVEIVAGQPTATTGTYTAKPGSLTVTLTPPEAVTAGAKWSVDGGAANDSGTTVPDLVPGTHTVSFTNVEGWITPQSQEASIGAGEAATATGIYTLTPGSLTVSITPPGAVAAGAKWSVDGGAANDSGTTVPDLPPGAHTVSFTNVEGWITPENQSATVVSGQTAEATGAYAQAGSLKVTIAPAAAVAAGARWRVDDGVWNNSEDTVGGLGAGPHQVAFSAATGWSPPVNQTVTVTVGETANITGTYLPSQFTLSTSVVGGHGTLSPSTGPQNANAVVTLAATPENGYQVRAWTGTDNNSLKTNTNTVTMSGNKTVSVEFETATPTMRSVPNVIGMERSAAVTVLMTAGLVAGTVTEQYSDTPTGQVTGQNPIYATLLAPGSSVSLTVSKGPKPVKVPELTGQARSAALAILTAYGLISGDVTMEFSNDVPNDQVIRQNPPSGTEVAPGSTVSLVISKGKEKTGVFSCNGQTERETSGGGNGADILTVLLAAVTLAAASLRGRPATHS